MESKNSVQSYYSIPVLLLVLLTGVLFNVGSGGSGSGGGGGGNQTWYLDSDGDEYGDPLVTINSKNQPAGYVADNTDGDDSDAGINPGAKEIPDDGIDQNCTGFDLQTWYKDADRDLYSDSTSHLAEIQPTNYYLADSLTSISGDCDDSDAGINPGATEIPDDGIDQDCTGYDLQTWYKDVDGDLFAGSASHRAETQYNDAYGVPYSDSTSRQAEIQPTNYYSADSLISISGDCDDSDAGINPGVKEIADDGMDQDCTGYDLQTWYKDADRDFYSDNTSQQAEIQPTNYYLADNLIAISGDCDDSDDGINPGAKEIADDGVDQDCSGLDLQTWYKDADGDLYSDNTSHMAEAQPTDYYPAYSLTSTSGDCDDSDAGINPGATEIPDDGIDQNCDGDDLPVWYADADSDGYGDSSAIILSATQPSGYVTDNTDCDDSDAGINPGATEIANDGIDQNCDGNDLPVWYADADSDGYGDSSAIILSATQPAGYVADNTDGDDGDAGINPGATEIADD
ncbi:MAG: putative metal-binding motif-containing protein, partial [Deltaproteobacteria bacterium]|nr:putative metal-binding motif-containing protein [Deltaproteobacteria bacterium]